MIKKKKKAFDIVLFFFIKKVDIIQPSWTQSAKNAITCFSFTCQKSINGSFHALQESVTQKKKEKVVRITIHH